MSRGFDSFEIDDFRTSAPAPAREIGADTTSSADDWRARQRVREEEYRSEHPSRDAQHRAGREHPPLPREERVRLILQQRTRSTYRDRAKTFALRDSEIHTLSEVAKFRVVAKHDLAEFAYNGDRSRMESDMENLERQGLARVTAIADTELNPREVVTLSKNGHKLVSRGQLVPPDQAIYHGLKKPREANHDADLYRLYHKVADEIEARGGRVLRVRLDYELKEELYSRLHRAAKDASRNQDKVKEDVAKRHHLKVVSGKIPIPDLRVEYLRENDAQIQRRDVELATDHYRPQALSEKARAGFHIYARPEDTTRLRRIRDEGDLMTAILRL